MTLCVWALPVELDYDFGADNGNAFTFRNSYIGESLPSLELEVGIDVIFVSDIQLAR